jgi:glycosyltransferase involved in cell wall biosynthesis
VEPGFEAVLGRLDLERVVMRGPLPGSALPAEYGEAAIFCLPSLEEGFGLVILQAMACGLPVVTTTETGGSDAGIDGRDLMLVPPADAASLAAALLCLAEDGSRREEMGAHARAAVSAGFGWADYGRRAVELYTRLKARRDAGR